MNATGIKQKKQRYSTGKCVSDVGESPKRRNPLVEEFILWSSETHGDLADQAQFQIYVFQMEAFRKNNREVENKKNWARERSQKGLEGVCEDCGRQIPTARLKPNEWATRCITCQEKYECKVRWR